MRHLCHDCGREVEEDRLRCVTCRRTLHRDCTDYHENFDPRCGEDAWIGALEY